MKYTKNAEQSQVPKTETIITAIIAGVFSALAVRAISKFMERERE